MAEIVVGITSLNHRLDAISGPATNRALMGRVALRTLAAMRTRIARKTSTTSRSLHVGTVTDTSARIEGNRNALWIDSGTRAHVIRPKTKKALRWGATAADRRLSGRPRKNANVLFAKSVRHPGTKPQPYIDASVREGVVKSGLADAVVERWNGAA